MLPTLRATPPRDNLYHIRSTQRGNPDFRKTYQEFEEIDWAHEHKKQRDTSTALGNTRSTIQSLLYTSEKWVIIFVAAVITGLVVLAIDVAAVWASDVKNGYCKTGFFKPKLACCSGEVEGARCALWRDWDFLSNLFGHFLAYALSSTLLAMTAFAIAARVPLSAKSGISEMKVIISGLVYQEFLSVRTLVAKAASLTLVVGAGLWVGKEGPLVHVAGCIMDLVGRLVARHPDEALKRELLVAAVAAGIGVAFNAPIGGVLFVLEQGYPSLKISNVMWKAFICATVAVVVLQSLHPFTEGRNVLFTVSNNRDWLSVEILPYMCLGVLGGIYGALFSKLNIKFALFRSLHFDTPKRRTLEMLCIAFATTTLMYPLIFGKLPLSQLTTRLFRDCDENDIEIIGGLCKDTGAFPYKPFLLLLFTGMEGFLLSSYTYGTLVPSGVLMPSLAVGACFGRALGLIIDHVQKNHPHWPVFSNCPSFVAPDAIATSLCVLTGAYGVVGAASFLAGITKTTASVVVIMFELTGALTYVLPIMISVLVAKVVNDSLVVKNFYEVWLRFQGFFFLDQNYKDSHPMSNASVERVIRKDAPVFYLSRRVSISSLAALLESLKSTDRTKDSVPGFPVLESEKSSILVGWISKHELIKEIKLLEGLPDFDMGKLVLFWNKSDHSGFSVSSSDSEASSESLSFHHLIEPCEHVPVFRSSLPVSTVADLFYKVNMNFMLFCDEHGFFKGMLTKYGLVDLVETNFSII